MFNGVTLTYSQSMAVRVALESFSADLINNGLGEDEIGKQITEGYLNNIREIRKALYKNNPHWIQEPVISQVTD